jgi:hypothetical protein
MALNLAPFGRWALRNKVAQLRSSLRYAAQTGISANATSKTKG